MAVEPRSATPRLIDEYLIQKRTNGLNLGRILSDGRMPDDFSGVAVMFDSTQSSKKSAA
jgi:hypothetical protein